MKKTGKILFATQNEDCFFFQNKDCIFSNSSSRTQPCAVQYRLILRPKINACPRTIWQAFWSQFSSGKFGIDVRDKNVCSCPWNMAIRRNNGTIAIQPNAKFFELQKFQHLETTYKKILSNFVPQRKLSVLFFLYEPPLFHRRGRTRSLYETPTPNST